MNLLAKALIKEMIYKVLPPGTVRQWKEGTYKKMANGSWARIDKPEKIKEKPKEKIKEKAPNADFFDKDISIEEMNVEAKKYINENKGKQAENPHYIVGQKIEVPYDSSENSGGYSGLLITADKNYYTILTETGIEEDSISSLTAETGKLY